MPFGAIFGALFFLLMGFWLAVATLGASGAPFETTRWALAAVSFVLALALLMRRAWARWLGVLVTALLVGLQLWAMPLGEGVGAHFILFGALLVAVLLVWPATGDVRRGLPEGSAPAPRLGRALGALAGIGVVAIAAGLWIGSREASAPGDTASTGGSSSPTLPASLSQRVSWSSFGKGAELARAENKPLLVTFITNWCGYCGKMDRTTWKDPDVIQRAGELVAVRVDAEETKARDGFKGVDLAARYGVQGYPTTLVLDAQGREVARTGGYQEPRQLLGWLDSSLARMNRRPPNDAVQASSP